MRGVAVFVFALLLVEVAVADKFYVSVNGSDSNPGTYSQPFQSISKAMSSLTSNDILNYIYLFSGEYSGIANVGLTIPYSVMLSIEESQEPGSVSITNIGSGYNVFSAARSTNVSVSLNGLTFTATESTSPISKVVYSDSGETFQTINVTNCIFDSFTYSVYVSFTTTNVIVDNCTFTESLIMLYSATGKTLSVSNSVFYSPDRAINIYEGSSIVVDTCQCYSSTHQGSGGCIVAAKTDSVTIRNSLFSNNTMGSVSISECQQVEIDSSQFIYNGDNPYGALVVASVTEGTINNCTFAYNGGDDGAGLALQSSNVTVSNSSFKENAATFAGGGAFCGNSNVVFSDCSFTDNTALYGAACAMDTNSHVTSDSNTFSGNVQKYQSMSCFPGSS